MSDDDTLLELARLYHEVEARIRSQQKGELWLDNSALKTTTTQSDTYCITTITPTTVR